MLTPALSAAAITSGSRTDPPGCTIARTPAAMRISGPSANGKKASDAATDPRRPLPRPFHRQPGRVDPVHLAHADADDWRRRRPAGSRSTSPTGTPARRSPGRRGSPRRPPGRRPGSRSPDRRRGRPAGPAAAPAGHRRWPGTRPDRARSPAGITSSRMFFFRVSTAIASSENAGASSTSVNTSAICSASASVTGRLTAITPPKADTGSQACASRWAAAIDSSAPPATAAIPHGLACLMIGDRRVGEIARRPPRGVHVDVVVVAHLLAVQLVRRGQARPPVPVQRGRLVRVLAVPQPGHLVPGRARPIPANRPVTGPVTAPLR